MKSLIAITSTLLGLGTLAAMFSLCGQFDSEYSYCDRRTNPCTNVVVPVWYEQSAPKNANILPGNGLMRTVSSIFGAGFFAISIFISASELVVEESIQENSKVTSAIESAKAEIFSEEELEKVAIAAQMRVKDFERDLTEGYALLHLEKNPHLIEELTKKPPEPTPANPESTSTNEVTKADVVAAVSTINVPFTADTNIDDIESKPSLHHKETELVEFKTDIPNLPSLLAQSLKLSLIVGVPGSGKGIFVSNALEEVKKLHPNTTVFYIDPKNDAKETAYFSGRVDKLFRKDLMTTTPEDAAQWITNCLSEYDRFDCGNGRKLLVFDELNLTLKTLKGVKGEKGEQSPLEWLKTKLTGYSSSGDSRGIVLWGISQNAHVSGLGMDGGDRTMFIPIFIVDARNISASEGILKAQMIPSDKRLNSTQIQQLCNKSEIGRAIFFGGNNEWYPMPRFENYSGFDRDSRSFLGDVKEIDSNHQLDPIISVGLQKLQEAESDLLVQSLSATYTPDGLTKEQLVTKIQYQQHQGTSQTKIIEMLWQVKKNQAGWKQAYKQFKHLMK